MLETSTGGTPRNYTVTTIWERECNRFREPAHYLHAEVLNIMNNRDIFYGGRVEVFGSMSQAALSKREEIRYIDVVSRYPHICAFLRVCTGHPRRLLLGHDMHADRLWLDNPTVSSNPTLLLSTVAYPNEQTKTCSFFPYQIDIY